MAEFSLLAAFPWAVATIAMDKSTPDQYWGMKVPIEVIVFGYADADCGPFPCDDQRTCGLDDCYPGGKFQDACAALEKALKKAYGNRVSFRKVLLDDGIPESIRSLIEEHHPPVPIILVNGRLVPLGRISFAHLKKFLTV
jgi:hypothetical protein